MNFIKSTAKRYRSAKENNKGRRLIADRRVRPGQRGGLRVRLNQHIVSGQGGENQERQADYASALLEHDEDPGNHG